MTDKLDDSFVANDVRLSPREWIAALIVVAAVLALIPVVWERVEPLQVEANHRMPFSLGSDYWTYSRVCRAACAREGTVAVVGDSVVWGHYVDKDETLSAHLNKAAGGERFANLGIDGIHPAALAGLMEHYGGAVAGRKVVLHCNLLWMSSERHDLQGTKEFTFNHPKLVPQFVPSIPCYKAPVSERLAIVIGRELPFCDWADHMQIAYFGNADLHTWTRDHPYDNPLGAVTLKLPSPDEPPWPEPVPEPWAKQGIRKFGPPWVELATSFQWRSFLRTIEILESRGDRVFVLLGPFNEHMLKQESLATYAERRAEAEAWFREHKIPHYLPPALPSKLYADASHPLGAGYRMLAEQLLGNEAFARFVGDKEPAR